MTDTEAEKIGREWAAKRGRVPFWGVSSTYWTDGPDCHGPGSTRKAMLPEMIMWMLGGSSAAFYKTEAAAYAALGRAVVRGREVFE